MAQSSPHPFDLRGLFGRVAPVADGKPSKPQPWPYVTAEAPPTSSLAMSTGWDELPGDSLVGDAMRFAEQRLRLADEIALELMLHPELADAPVVVQNFLLRLWPVVIAHARLADGSRARDPGGYLGVVDDLLWSVRREATLRRPSRLFHLIPGLLERLRAGLALLGEAPMSSADFFRALEKLHQPVLRLCAKRRNDAPSEPVFASAAALDPAATLEALRPGAWVDLYSRQHWLRAQLEWVDPQRRQFLFIGQHGRLHTMTRRILERLVTERLLRLAEGPDAAWAA